MRRRDEGEDILKWVMLAVIAFAAAMALQECAAHRQKIQLSHESDMT